LVLADNRFTLKLFRRVASTTPTDSNNVVSPFSVAIALAMAYNGAAGRTHDEMQRALSLEGMTLQGVNEAYRALPHLLRGLDPQVCFQLANSAWYRPTFSPMSSFLDATKTYFGAQVRSIDFDAASAAPTINAWVSDNTGGRIKAMVPNPIPSDVHMYLVNAVYFKGSWTTPFDSLRTHPQRYQLATGDTTMVRMMESSGEVGASLYEEGGVTVFDLPYGGRTFSMTIVLPPTPKDIDSLVRNLSDDRWSAWMKGLAPRSLLVSLPRFTVSSAAALNAILSDLGMRTAFCGRWKTDFTRLDPTGKTCITDVRHGAWVQVNEEGTEAAAATSVGLGVTSLPPHVVVDRPFVFAIRERFSGAILFLGKVMNPGAR
jgi:serpin B